VLFHADCREVLRNLADDSVDSVVTDPPYDLTSGGTGGFMGQKWDGTGVAFDPATWKECLRVLKPGGHLVSFGGTRTYHRMACAIEDAGFEIRDSLHWLYGSGFPKDLDLGKATDEAKQWDGWHGALKPAHEPIILARKPLSEKTVAANVLKHGTGGINVDACRVSGVPWQAHRATGLASVKFFTDGDAPVIDKIPHEAGRWPPNALFSHSATCVPVGEKQVRNLSGSTRADVPSAVTDAVYGERERVAWQAHGENGMETVQAWDCSASPDCPVAEMDRQSGVSKSRRSAGRQTPKQGTSSYGDYAGTTNEAGHDDSGGASRFFPQFEWSLEYDFPYLYCAKAPRKERPAAEGYQKHPTTKPLALMRWLVKLVTPPGGVILDPFCGTGTTLQAAGAEGFRSIGCDSWEDAIAQACARLDIEVNHAGDSDPEV